MPTTIARIPDLPNEILHFIIEELPLIDLKNVRLGSKLLAMLAEPRLFRHMILVPYVDCLEGFAQLMQETSLAQHVQSLCYDGRRRYNRCAMPTPPDVARTVNKILAENGFWNDEQEGLESMLLVGCLKTLPMLKELLVPDLDMSPAAPNLLSDLLILPSYFRRISRDADISFNRSEAQCHPSAKIALLASHFAKSTYTKFCATSLYHIDFLEDTGRDAPPKEFRFYNNTFRNLKELSLEFAPYHGAQETYANKNLGSLITIAANVERLTLKVCNRDVNLFTMFESKHSWLHPIARHPDGKLCTEPTLPRLTHLTLGHMVCQEVELLTLIHNHRYTLKRLELQEMSLVKGSEQASPPCWVRVLKTLRSYRIPLSLEGKFTNLHRQWWNISKANQPIRQPSLKAQVERWALGKGKDAYPLEKAAVKVGPDNKEIVPSREEFFRGDSTWSMVRWNHESLEDENSDEEPDDDYYDEDDFDDDDSVFVGSFSEDYSDYSDCYEEGDYDSAGELVERLPANVGGVPESLRGIL